MGERPLARPNRLLLISCLAVVLLFSIVAFAGSSATARAVPRRQDSLADLTDTADAQTADVEDTADAQTADVEDTADAQTADVEDTASAQTDAAQAGSPSPTSTTTQTGTPSSGSATVPAITPVQRAPASPTPTPRVITLSPLPTPTATFEQVPTLVESVPPTPTPLVADALPCPAGVPILLRGYGPPHAAYLLFFGTRAVGGGSVAADGTFTARLVIGSERAGDYLVAVRLRSTLRLLLQQTCAVPAATPLPQPQRP